MTSSGKGIAGVMRLALTAAIAAAAGAREIRTRPVEFPAGASSVRLAGSIQGFEIIDFKLRAEQGQVLRTTLTSTNPSAYHNILRPEDGKEAIFIGSTLGEKFEGELPTTGEFTLRVYLMRNAAPRGERAEFTLQAELTASPKETGGPQKTGNSPRP